MHAPTTSKRRKAERLHGKEGQRGSGEVSTRCVVVAGTAHQLAQKHKRPSHPPRSTQPMITCVGWVMCVKAVYVLCLHGRQCTRCRRCRRGKWQRCTSFGNHSSPELRGRLSASQEFSRGMCAPQRVSIPCRWRSVNGVANLQAKPRATAADRADDSYTLLRDSPKVQYQHCNPPPTPRI